MKIRIHYLATAKEKFRYVYFSVYFDLDFCLVGDVYFDTGNPMEPSDGAFRV